jgi:pimeloyl-ACP methyl ester carboxylesterase
MADTDAPRSIVCQSGHTLSFVDAGPVDAQALVLIHGLASDSGTWDLAIPALAERGLRVIAPDLLGHGRSDKPAYGYSLDGFARSLAELLDAIGVARATFVGHSLGGAAAMHFHHNYPGYLERLVLVASGGLGKHVHPVLRAATLPGAHALLRLFVNRRTAAVYRTAQLHRALRLPPAAVANLRRAGRGLSSPDGRAAFFATLHAVINPSGQLTPKVDYFAHDVPTLIVWSCDDHVIPVSHAYATHRRLPASRLELFPGSTHQPHYRHADRFADVVADFVGTTAPAPPSDPGRSGAGGSGPAS